MEDTHNPLLEELQRGWAPLPGSTLLSMVLGGLKVRLMRSMVTMVSIILAIAFLSYTSLSNRLYQNVALKAIALAETKAMDPALITAAARELRSFDLAASTSIEQRMALGRYFGLHRIGDQERELIGITAPLQRASVESNAASAALAEVQSDPDALLADIEAARSRMATATARLSELQAARNALEAEIGLGRWIRTGEGDGAKMEASLNAQIADRQNSLLTRLGRHARLTDQEIAHAKRLAELAASVGGPETAVTNVLLGLAETQRVKEVQDIELRLRRAGISVEAAARGGDTADIWLIVMALMTCAVGIANAVLMSVTERFREIGTMKCLGAQDDLVVKMFLLEAGMLGVVGALLGILMGILVAAVSGVLQFGLYGLTSFPLAGAIPTVFLSLLAGIFLSVAGAAYPSLVASRMQPVDALRVDE